MRFRPGGVDPARSPSGSVAAMSSQKSDGQPGRTEGGANVPKWLVALSVVVLVAGLVVLTVAGVRYAQDREVASERDTVSDVASQVIINAFSFDHESVDESLEHLAEVSTGDFLAEQGQWAEDVRTRVVEQSAVTTATVSHTAVSSLDADAGEAGVLVVFTAHSEREGQEPITGRQAMRVDMVREDGDWKASAVNQVGVTVPVGESSQAVQGLQAPESGDAGAGSEGSGEAGEPESGEAGADAGSEDSDGAGADETDANETGEESAPTSEPTSPGGR